MRSYLTQNVFTPQDTCKECYTCKVHFSNDINNSKLCVFTINRHKNFTQNIKVLQKTQNCFNDFSYRINIKTNLFLSYEKAS